MSHNCCSFDKPKPGTAKFRLSAPFLYRDERFGVYGAGALGNQPRGRPRPLGERGWRGYAQCCAGIGAANANLNGIPCCPTRTRRASTYQGIPPPSRMLAGRTQANGMTFVPK